MRQFTSSIAAMVPASLMPTVVAAQGTGDSARYVYGPHMMWWGGGWPGMILGPLFMILVLATVIVLAVLLVRWIGGAGQIAAPQTPTRTPLDILKERFARGEIDKAEFEERRQVLEE